MKYLNGSFKVPVGGKAYADGWERTFGRPQPSVTDEVTVELCRCGRRLSLEVSSTLILPGSLGVKTCSTCHCIPNDCLCSPS